MPDGQREVGIVSRSVDPGKGWVSYAAAERDTMLLFLDVEPVFAPLRGDRRYAELRHRVGLDRP